MDLITLDVSHAPEVGPGDMIDLIGPHHDVDALAAEAGTIGYEILTSLGRRYRRDYIEASGAADAAGAASE
jgi:alanine racemase